MYPGFQIWIHCKVLGVQLINMGDLNEIAIRWDTFAEGKLDKRFDLDKSLLSGIYRDENPEFKQMKP